MDGPEVGQINKGTFLKLPPKVMFYAEKLATLEGLSLDQYFIKLVSNDLERTRNRSLPIATRVVKEVLNGIPHEIKQVIGSIGQKRSRS